MYLKLLPLLILIALGCAVSLRNWRAGLLLCIVTALLQDPIRKVTPGTPPWLTVAFVPIYLCMVLGLCTRQSPLRDFRQDFPQMTMPMTLMVVAVLISFFKTLTYGLSAAPIAVLGLFSYAGAFPAVLLGYKFLEEDSTAIEKLFMFFAIVTSLMLIGVPLEYSDYQFSEPWLGTVSLKRAWYRWYSTPTMLDAGYIKMISGFYRSPEIMGWHAMTLVLVSLFLMLRNRNWLMLWSATATWGLYCVLLSGRRKMFLMILVFLFVFILSFRQWRRTSWMLPVVTCIALLAGGLLSVVDDRYITAAESGLHNAGSTAVEKGIAGPLELLERVGPFGFGVGTKTQGAQHVGFKIPVPEFEGGFEKILVELGVVGTFAAVFVVLTGFLMLYKSMNHSRSLGQEETVGVALFSMICANLASFVVTFQIFGDPFVIVFIGFLGGMLLSLPRCLPVVIAPKARRSPTTWNLAAARSLAEKTSSRRSRRGSSNGAPQVENAPPAEVVPPVEQAPPVEEVV